MCIRDRIIAARKDAPLLLVCGRGENFLASDVTALLRHTRDVVYMDDGELAEMCIRDSGMAKGGSGDVLTGLLTGLLAQGMEPFDACCAAVWILSLIHI